MAPFVAIFNQFLPQSRRDGFAAPTTFHSRQVAHLGYDLSSSSRLRQAPPDESSYLAYLEKKDTLHNSIITPTNTDFVESDTPLQLVTASLS